MTQRPGSRKQPGKVPQIQAFARSLHEAVVIFVRIRGNQSFGGAAQIAPTQQV
jgi:hypothetical protein